MRSAQFYHHDEALLEALTQFTTRQLERGDIVVMITTAPRASRLHANLTENGTDVAALADEGRYVAFDALAMLAMVVSDAGFDASGFSKALIAPIGAVQREGHGVAAFCEVPALLSAAARHEAAIDFDRAWCELGRNLGARLLRAYPLDAPIWRDERASTLMPSFARRDALDSSGELGRWETLRRMNVALGGEFDESRLMQTVLDAAVELVGATRGVLLRRDDDSSSLWLRTETGIARMPPEAVLPRAELVVATLLDQRVMRCDALESGVAFAAASQASGMRSYLAVPVTNRSGRVRGGIFLLNADAGTFTPRDQLLLEALAAQAAIALDNAQLRHATDLARQQQRALNETLEQRIAERTAELHRSETQLEQLVSGIADYAIYLLDPEGRVLTWNTGAERTMGYSATEIIGERFTRFHTTEDCAAGLPDGALAVARRTGKYESEGWRVRKDGKRFWAGVLIDAIHDGNGKVSAFAKVTRDMTERRAIEEQLHQSQRMEAMGRMTGGVAHDFNNLLTIIIGNLDAVCRERELKPKVRTASEHALRGAQRAAALTQQLLAFSRRQPLNPRPTNVNHLVAGTVELLKRTFGESILISAELGADPGTCDIDAAQLENALINLAMNARDAMPSGGHLALSTSNTTREDRVVPDVFEELVTISITDSGVGMSDHVREHAFEPFFTTKPAGRGTGLGLSQVYGFVNQSGGRVTLRSETGRGTTISIHLPRLDYDMPGTKPVPIVERPAGGGTLVLVEDNEDVRRYSAGMLRELGFLVLETADAEAALELLARREDVRLLFTDVHLPGMQGDALARQAHASRPDVRVLLTTGYAHDGLAIDGDYSALLNKPYTRAQLADAIGELLDAAPVPGARMRALLVEDDALLRDLAARMLEHMQFEVEQADSLSAALRLIEQARRFDFALVDRLLGDGDGIEAAHAVRAKRPGTPVLLTSGYDQPDTLANEAFFETMRKPYGYDALTDALARLGVRPDLIKPVRAPSKA